MKTLTKILDAIVLGNTKYSTVNRAHDHKEMSNLNINNIAGINLILLAIIDNAVIGMVYLLITKAKYLNNELALTTSFRNIAVVKHNSIRH